MIFSHGRIVVDVVIEIERTRYTMRGCRKLTPETIFSTIQKMANQWGLEHYKGYLIDDSAVPTFGIRRGLFTFRSAEFDCRGEAH